MASVVLIIFILCVMRYVFGEEHGDGGLVTHMALACHFYYFKKTGRGISAQHFGLAGVFLPGDLGSGSYLNSL